MLHGAYRDYRILYGSEGKIIIPIQKASME